MEEIDLKLAYAFVKFTSYKVCRSSLVAHIRTINSKRWLLRIFNIP